MVEMAASLDEFPRFEVALGDSCYPAALAATEYAPARLYGIGDVLSLVVGFSVVGARRATPYGLQAAELFAGYAARAGYTVVSGGAIGCDQAAHRSALAHGGPSVAVLGCGADVVYPRSAAELLAEVAASGAVISEHPWGTPPAKWRFRTRNRIIAGLSGALLVVEAGLPSGTFVTADYALSAGRDVLVVPGSIFAPECRGANRLLRQGATPVTDVSELSLALEASLGPPPRAPGTLWSLDGASATADPVLAAIRTSHLRPDDIARALALDIVTVARRIGRLEMEGLVVRFPDGRYGATPARERC
jgi:DNA processing protein